MVKTLRYLKVRRYFEAARSAEIDIPTLCDHPQLTPYGGCRLCLVEVEGARTLQPSCTMPVSNNMVVQTDYPKSSRCTQIRADSDLQRTQSFLPVLPGHRRRLRTAKFRLCRRHDPLAAFCRIFSPIPWMPRIHISSWKTTAASSAAAAYAPAVSWWAISHSVLKNAAQAAFLVADTGVPLGESTCISCGTCVQVCPTGALIDRWSAYRGHETQVDQHPDRLRRLFSWLRNQCDYP